MHLMAGPGALQLGLSWHYGGQDPTKPYIVPPHADPFLLGGVPFPMPTSSGPCKHAACVSNRQPVQTRHARPLLILHLLDIFAGG